MFWFIDHYKWFIKKIWASLVFIAVLGIIENAIRIYIPYFIGQSLDLMAAGSMTKDKLTDTLIILISVSLLLYAVAFLWAHTTFRNPLLLEKQLRVRFYRFLTERKPAYFIRHRTGHLFGVSSNDIPSITQVMGEGVLSIINICVTTPIYLFAMLFFVSYKLTIAALLPLPLIAISINILGKRINRKATSLWSSFDSLNNKIHETISGMRIIRAYVQEEQNQNDFDRLNDECRKRSRAYEFTNALFWPSVSLFMGLSMAIAIGYGSFLVRSGEISIGQLIAFFTYLAYMSFPLFAFGALTNTIQSAKASEDRLLEVFEEDVDGYPKEGLSITSESIPYLETKQLNYRYEGQASDCLKSIDLRLEAGRTLGIVGPTGSGKSTLLKLILGQLEAPPRTLYYGEHPIEHLRGEEMRGRLAYVPQEQMLFSDTIHYNVSLGRESRSSEAVEEALKRACMWDEVFLMADGIDTVIGNNGQKLSGGQKQRIAIARSLLADPEILLMDDALSSVDAEKESLLINNLKEVRTNKTTIIVSNRLSAVKHADHIIVLRDGEIKEEGTHEQLVRFNGWYSEQLVRQKLKQMVAQRCIDEGVPQ